MSKRVPASATTRKRLEELMDDRTVSADARREFVKLATRLLVEESGEAEAGDAVGREYYRHGEGHGYRNGYRYHGHQLKFDGRSWRLKHAAERLAKRTSNA